MEMARIERRGTLAAQANLALYICRRELASRYAGSVFGVAWAIVFPVLQILLYAAVLHFGLRLQVGGGEALLASLIAGMLPWFAFNEALTTMTGSITGNASLVKHLAIPTGLLPIATLLAAGSVHLVMIIIATVALALLGVFPGAHILLLLYFCFCLVVLALSVGVLLALANTVFRDVGHAVGPVLGLWFWATPIIWPAERLPAGLQWIVTANPVSYVVAGYRRALLGPMAAPVEVGNSLWFWATTGLLAFCAWQGFRLFRRELADLV
jgi:ABC-type polysaccharide/polyol phosphate export permease